MGWKRLVSKSHASAQSHPRLLDRDPQESRNLAEKPRSGLAAPRVPSMSRLSASSYPAGQQPLYPQSTGPGGQNPVRQPRRESESAGCLPSEAEHPLIISYAAASAPAHSLKPRGDTSRSGHWVSPLLLGQVPSRLS